VFFNHRTPVPVDNHYGTPDTLGLDRLAAVIGGMDWAKGPLLAIDLGTCITYDFLNEEGAYKGGAISPGLQMRAKAMATQTANLPLVEINPEVGFVGNSTVTCLQSCVYYGVMAEISGIIENYSQNHDDLKVFICGGDAKYFERLTKDHIFVIPNLVLHGLNRILTYNVDKK
jgi:type III pantothenate kinase